MGNGCNLTCNETLLKTNLGGLQVPGKTVIVGCQTPAFRTALRCPNLLLEMYEKFTILGIFHFS
jgi:hypothetical protein